MKVVFMSHPVLFKTNSAFSFVFTSLKQKLKDKELTTFVYLDDNSKSTKSVVDEIKSLYPKAVVTGIKVNSSSVKAKIKNHLANSDYCIFVKTGVRVNDIVNTNIPYVNQLGKDNIIIQSDNNFSRILSFSEYVE